MLYYVEIPQSRLKLEGFDEALKKGFADSPMRYEWVAGETFVEQNFYVLLVWLPRKVGIKEMKLRFRNMFGSVGKCEYLLSGAYGYIDQTKPIVGYTNLITPTKIDDSDVEICEAVDCEADETKDIKKRKIQDL